MTLPAPTAPQRIWIDCDMGFDDLAAILLVQAAGCAVDGLSLVAGNAALDQVISNAAASAQLFGWNFPIHAGADAAVNGSQTDAAYVLGRTGMPSTGRQLPACDDAPASRDAVGAMIAWLDAGGHHVLALGPLTNIALMLRTRPDLARQMHLVWMGGSATTGNHTATAEFNAFCDPEAVAEVITAGATVHMVGLDCCRQVCVTGEDANVLRALPGPQAALLADLLMGYACIRDPSGRLPMALFDPVAAAAMVCARTVTFRPAHLDCELDGTLTRGMTVIEWRAHKAAPNAMIADRADPDTIRALFMQGLIAAATPPDSKDLP